MTTPPQGPWGPGQPGGQPGGQQGGQGGQPPQQGGWGQQPPGQGGGGWGQRPQQPQQGQPPHGQPPQGPSPQGPPPQQGQPPQQGGWGQQPGQPQQGRPGPGQTPGQPPQQSGWGQRSAPPQQQSWGQQGQQQQGGWHQQQGGQAGGPQWQQGGPGGPGGSKGPGGISKDKLPLVIGGGVVGIVLIGLLVFLGIHAFGGDDTPESNPTTSQSGGEPTKGGGDNNGELGNATGQAKTATEKLQGAGFGCSDLFNTSQGAQRGCFKYDGATQAEAIFQFQPDGTVIGVKLTSQDQDNVNNAKVTFTAALQALGDETFGGDQVQKVQDALANGQKTQKVGSSWGEFQLRNEGDTVVLSGGKSGSDSYDVPKKNFDTTGAQMTSALKTKGYVCTSSCSKQVGKFGSQRVYFYASEGEGIKDITMSSSGDPSDVKKALPTAVNDAFGVLKGGDGAALKSYIQAHSDGKSYASYVAGWRVEITGNSEDDFASQQIEITYESFYV